jgi:hypothetical protein
MVLICRAAVNDATWLALSNLKQMKRPGLHSSRHAREGGHPVISGASDRIDKPRYTGSSAFADDDDA